MEATNGIIAFLDILGYQNFIDNNSVEKAVDILTKVFSGLKEAVAEDYKNWFKSPAPIGRVERVVIQTLSDSIIFHLPGERGATSVADWVTLLQAVRITQRRLFENGFPARGTVASGEYFFGNGFLVGRPFMDAFRLTQSLEFAGVVLTPNALTQLKSDWKRDRFALERFRGGVEFLAPLKDGREQKLYCISPLRQSEIGTDACRDVDAMVRRSFWHHQKDVPASVDIKVHNTIKFLTYWIYRRE
jgi:hypothetical protein